MPILIGGLLLTGICGAIVWLFRTTPREAPPVEEEAPDLTWP